MAIEFHYIVDNFLVLTLVKQTHEQLQLTWQNFLRIGVQKFQCYKKQISVSNAQGYYLAVMPNCYSQYQCLTSSWRVLKAVRILTSLYWAEVTDPLIRTAWTYWQWHFPKQLHKWIYILIYFILNCLKFFPDEFFVNTSEISTLSPASFSHREPFYKNSDTFYMAADNA
jgi:hypothetical protein